MTAALATAVLLAACGLVTVRYGAGCCCGGGGITSCVMTTECPNLYTAGGVQTSLTGVTRDPDCPDVNVTWSLTNVIGTGAAGRSWANGTLPPSVSPFASGGVDCSTTAYPPGTPVRVGFGITMGTGGGGENCGVVNYGRYYALADFNCAGPWTLNFEGFTGDPGTYSTWPATIVLSLI